MNVFGRTVMCHAALLGAFLHIALMLNGSSCAQEPVTPPPREATEDASPQLPWNKDFSAGLSAAQVSGKPPLVVVGGEGCVWCRRLEQEMLQPRVRESLDRWTLIYVDVDNAPDIARKFGVGPIPALRIFSPTGTKVASHDGFLSGPKLIDWLEDHYRDASTKSVDLVLVDRELPSDEAVTKLIEYLDHRDPLVRQAAIARLSGVPNLAGPALVGVLEKGKLSSRLAAVEIFEDWGGPIENVDPWRPETITADQLTALKAWQAEFSADDAKQETLTAEQLADAQRQIERLLRADATEGAAIAARLAKHRELLLPEVYRRIENAATDAEREKLLALRYRLVASDAFALNLPGELARLASSDAQTRRQSAQRVAEEATIADQPLLLELFSDSDPLIRELALAGLEQLGGETATASLVRLLSDPEPNVRAAVLKQLAEQASPQMAPKVAAYLQTEKDPDLLVHGIRYLREVPGAPSAKALLPLLEHEAWQVRAEAAEALQKFLDDDLPNEQAELAADVIVALVKRLDDADAFVVSRAVSALSSTSSPLTLQPMIAAAEKHPQLAPHIIENLSSLPALRNFAKSTNVEVRSAAVIRLMQLDENSFAAAAPAGLADESKSVRIAAAKILAERLGELQRQKIYELRSGDDVFSSRPAPTRPQAFLERAFDSLFGGQAPAAPEDVEVEEAETAEEVDDRDPFDDAEPARPAAPAEAPEAAEEPAEFGEEIAGENEPSKQLKFDPLAPDDRYDKWLLEVRAGKGAFAPYTKLQPALEKMFAADAADERLAAFGVLAPLGKVDTSLDSLTKLVGDEGAPFELAASLLPWLPWEERLPRFQELRAAAKTPEELAAIISGMTDANDVRATTIYWDLLAEPALSLELAGELTGGLISSYFGERYEISRAGKAKQKLVAEIAQAKVVAGPEAQRIAALVLLTHLDQKLAADLARKLSSDESLSQELRHDAFQVMLVTLPEPERLALAQAAIADEDEALKQMALEVLVMGTRNLQRLRDDYNFSLSGSGSEAYFSASEPIIPQPPKGLTIEQVRPLLEHPQARKRALAGYLLALLGDAKGLAPLIEFYRSDEAKYEYELPRLVYRAISATNSKEHIPVLREIYGTLDEYDVREFYWTIRIMSGSEILKFRSEIRKKVGIQSLR